VSRSQPYVHKSSYFPTGTNPDKYCVESKSPCKSTGNTIFYHFINIPPPGAVFYPELGFCAEWGKEGILSPFHGLGYWNIVSSTVLNGLATCVADGRLSSCAFQSISKRNRYLSIVRYCLVVSTGIAIYSKVIKIVVIIFLGC